MNKLIKLAVAAVCLALACLPVRAQTTDAYHAIQVFPVVVDTASFVQRFTFKNPNASTLTIVPLYFPAEGTAQATPLTCPSFDIPANKAVVITSLRTMCPALASGSQFGFLWTSVSISTPSPLPFAAFSRVSNIAGNGFSVEAFAATQFTSADSVVTGIRRLAAGPSSPAYQTNCFIGNIYQVQPDFGPLLTPVHYTVYNSAAAVIGQGDVSMVQGKLTRLLDVFAAAGVPAGDYNDAQIKFEEMGTDEPGIMSFCTVQDSTSFGADFRIGKQEVGDGVLAYPGRIVGPQDNYHSREILMNVDYYGRPFEIAASASSSNSHLLYFHTADIIFCELINPATGLRALTSYGLEMRVVAPDGTSTIAGGNDMVSVDAQYAGDRATSNNDGANWRISIEVEDAERNSAAVRPYKLHCRSGSGTTLGDLARYKEVVDRF